MDIMANAIGIAADDQKHFAMRLQPDHTIDDMRASLFQPACPLNVDRFVEARAQFDDSGHLFARIGRIDEDRDNGRIAAGAIQRDLDGKHLRILGRFFNQIDNRIKTIVGVMKKNILPAQDLKNVRMRRKRGVTSWLKGPVFQLGKGVVRNERRQMRHRERTIDLVDIGLGQFEKFEQ